MSPVLTKSVIAVALPSAFIAAVLCVAPFALTVVLLSTANVHSSVFPFTVSESLLTADTVPDADMVFALAAGLAFVSSPAAAGLVFVSCPACASAGTAIVSNAPVRIPNNRFIKHPWPVRCPLPAHLVRQARQPEPMYGLLCREVGLGSKPFGNRG